MVLQAGIGFLKVSAMNVQKEPFHHMPESARLMPDGRLVAVQPDWMIDHDTNECPGKKGTLLLLIFRGLLSNSDHQHRAFAGHNSVLVLMLDQQVMIVAGNCKKTFKGTMTNGWIIAKQNLKVKLQTTRP